MAAGGDIVELVHTQTYLQQDMHNVYHFEAVTAGASLSDLASWFELNVVPAIKAIQVDTVQHLSLNIRNLFDATENHTEILTGVGVHPASIQELPSFLALTIRFEHIQQTVRPGFKRWSGISETQIQDAVVTAGELAKMVTLGNLLINPPSIANPAWAHVIVQRICETPNPVPGAVPSCLKYRLPTSAAEAVVGYPVTHEPYAEPTTQNSRKWYT